MRIRAAGVKWHRNLDGGLAAGAVTVLLLLGIGHGGGCATGVPSEDPCGNGYLDDGEECDGTNYGGATCESLERGSGTLSCDEACHIVVSGCSGGSCGNDIMDPGEACDGENLGGRSCLTEGFTAGELRCGASCELDTSGCNNDACGNGNMNPGEMCDDGNLIEGDGCDGRCVIETGWECSGAPSVCVALCGNSAVDPSEDCDGADLDGATCVTLGYDSGPLACSPTCFYDTSLCVGAPPCGNGVVEGTEECDGANLSGATCLNLGWDMGILTCATDCTLDTSLCAYQTCGNGTIDAGEDCDGANLGSATCVSEGFPGGGTLGCTSGCSFNTSGCVSVTCGNGSIDTGEECDGSDLGGQTCVSRGYTGGTLACSSSCSFNESGCTSSGVCGNGTVEAGEDCDDGGTQSGDGCDAGCHWENTCSIDLAMACNTSVSGAIGLFRFDDHVNYMTSCSTSAATGPEDIISFVPPNSGTASINLDVVNEGFIPDDLDLYVLGGGCNEQLCVGAGETSGDDYLSVPVVAGQTYYVVVEQYTLGFPPLGEYNLTVNCP